MDSNICDKTCKNSKYSYIHSLCKIECFLKTINYVPQIYFNISYVLQQSARMKAILFIIKFLCFINTVFGLYDETVKGEKIRRTNEKGIDVFLTPSSSPSPTVFSPASPSSPFLSTPYPVAPAPQSPNGYNDIFLTPSSSPSPAFFSPASPSSPFLSTPYPVAPAPQSPNGYGSLSDWLDLLIDTLAFDEPDDVFRLLFLSYLPFIIFGEILNFLFSPFVSSNKI